jgi:hypothetical protein
LEGAARLDSTDAMTKHRSASPSPAAAGLVPPALVPLMTGFRGFFTAPVWDHVLVLVAGALLAPGKRTVSAALRIMGLGTSPGFARYHHVLSRARWDSRAVARKLLALTIEAFLPDGPIVIGIDDTIERRWGAKISDAIAATPTPPVVSAGFINVPA